MPSAQVKLTSSQLLNLQLHIEYAPLYCACHSTIKEATTQKWDPGNYLSEGAFTPQVFGPLLNWWTWNNFQPGFSQQCNSIRRRHTSLVLSYFSWKEPQAMKPRKTYSILQTSIEPGPREHTPWWAPTAKPTYHHFYALWCLFSSWCSNASSFITTAQTLHQGWRSCQV